MVRMSTNHEACDFKGLHNGLVDVAHHHATLLVHAFLGCQDHPKAGGREVLQVLKIQNQPFDVSQRGVQFPLQLGAVVVSRRPARRMVSAQSLIFF